VIVDKTRYSPFLQSPFQAIIAGRRVDTLIVSGAETDVCVLATVLDAVDLGYRVVVAADTVCSSSGCHDAQRRDPRGPLERSLAEAEPDAINRLLSEDVVLTSRGHEIGRVRGSRRGLGRGCRTSSSTSSTPSKMAVASLRSSG
jgi:hypothetical protein